MKKYKAKFSYKVGSTTEQLAPPIRNYLDLPCWSDIEKTVGRFDQVECKESLATVSKDVANAKKPVLALQSAIAAMVATIVAARDADRKKESSSKKRGGDDVGKSLPKKRRTVADVFELVGEVPVVKLSCQLKTHVLKAELWV